MPICASIPTTSLSTISNTMTTYNAIVVRCRTALCSAPQPGDPTIG
ncbi:hypothetical protein VD0002_g4817 [Verticillium dahliae]|uniref:Uncharacterized protein n=1 Tax=Verticillium dahliae TaxID=27337 RepID=A0AA44WRQ3_VERDA|nr:hypothetical protein BJF96_g1010 [Verticillium dahliae]PNH42022.1 hypothetical protein VD0003_g9879 [Verticillium dahliae]PNH63595.1 hypothetical protein VD0002_g4817 [Verticillium dahliae]